MEHELAASERALCTRLRGLAVTLTPAIVTAARRHRVHLLLAASLTPAERVTTLGAQLVRDLTVAAALDEWRADDTRLLLDALARAGAATLVLKGAAFAHTLYETPQLRPRLDLDLLVRRESLDDAERALAEAGWMRPTERDAELGEPQRHYVKQGSDGRPSHVDVHWKIAIPRAFGESLSFDDLDARAMPIPALGHAARTLCRSDALLVACMHRVAHHNDGIDLLWLWDIHLLVEWLSPADRLDFAARAGRMGMSAVCVRGVGLAADLFGTHAGAETIRELEAHRVSGDEPSARFIGGVRPVAVLADDLRTLGWDGRLRLLGEHLFPSRAYMRVRYPGWPKVALPLAYIVRIAAGAPRWFRRDTMGGARRS
jgi:hypothetical protein